MTDGARITVGWEDEAAGILRWDITDPAWTLNDFWAANDATGKRIDTHTGRVDLIVVTPPRLPAPDGLMSALRSVARDTSDGPGLVVMVGPGNLVEVLMSAMQRTYTQTTYNMNRWHFCRTVDEARALIAQNRAQHAAEQGS